MRLVLTLLATLGLLLTGAATARACSCVGGDPRDRLSEARAAFVGTVVDQGGSTTRPTYRLTVERTFMGDLPATVEVSSDARTTCAAELAVGERVGLLLRRAAPPYEVGLCDAIEPDELAAATQEYPPGPGAGTARLLVAGTFHDAGLAALDGRGRLIGWAFGSEGEALDVCPGAGYALQAGDDVSVIRLRDLAVVDRRRLPDATTSAVRCLSQSGDRFAALTFDYGARSERSRLIVSDGGRVRDLGVRPTASVALGTQSAHLTIISSDAYRVVAVDYSTRRARTLVAGAGSVGSLALSPDERWLAFVAAPPRWRPARLGVASTSAKRVRTRAVGRFRAPLWLSNRRLALPGERRAGDSFDRRLRRRGAVASWSTDRAVAAGRRVWWLESGTGLRGRDLGDTTSSRTTVDYLGGGRGLAAIPGGRRVSGGSDRAPRAGADTATSACGSRSRQ